MKIDLSRENLWGKNIVKTPRIKSFCFFSVLMSYRNCLQNININVFHALTQNYKDERLTLHRTCEQTKKTDRVKSPTHSIVKQETNYDFHLYCTFDNKDFFFNLTKKHIIWVYYVSKYAYDREIKTSISYLYN